MTNTKHNNGSRPANAKGAWNCDFCHATNVSSLCGCAASKKAAGREPAPEVDLDSITLYF